MRGPVDYQAPPIFMFLEILKTGTKTGTEVVLTVTM